MPPCRVADLVIEAVFEDPRVKAQVIGRVEAAIAADCIVASNTSTLPISGLSAASRSPEKVIGIYFFSPVEKMMLVEIILGKETRRAGARRRARLRARDQEDADRRQRCARLLR